MSENKDQQEIEGRELLISDMLNVKIARGIQHERLVSGE